MCKGEIQMKNKTNVWDLIAKIFVGVSIGLILLGLVFFVTLQFLDFDFAVVFGGIWAGIGVFFGVFAIGIFLVRKSAKDKMNRFMESGSYVMADIIDIDVNPMQKVQTGTMKMHPYFIVCRYMDGNGQEYIFRSKNLYYNPSGLLKSNQLKVYVDLANPRKYFVDTDTILPGDAVLHKWTFTTKGNEKLIETGKYVQATTCGIEHHGRIRVSGMCLPHFREMSPEMAAKLNMGADEKNRGFVGYTILCRYDETNGKTHIFASKMLFGEPESDYMDMPVKVYYSGSGYKNYHVDLRDLGIYE